VSFLSAPLVDVQAGVLATTLPPVEAPVFLRLRLPESDEIDAARRLYLRLATPDLRAGVAGWRDGAGLFVAEMPRDPRVLAAEVHEVARALGALGDLAVARTYLALMQPRAADDPGAEPHGGMTT
jgi:hypothetical protein